MYVMDTGNKRVQVFRPDGTFMTQWGGGGVVDGRFDEPVGLAQDAGGQLVRDRHLEQAHPEVRPGLAVRGPVAGERLGGASRW